MSNKLAEIDRLAELAKLVAARIPGLIEEARDQINEAITAAVEDAQDKTDASDKEIHPTLALNIAVKWDLDGQSVEITMPVAVKRKFTVSVKMSDPNQPELLENEGVADAAKQIRRAMREGRASVTMHTTGAAADVQTEAERIAGGAQ